MKEKINFDERRGQVAQSKKDRRALKLIEKQARRLERKRAA